MLPKRHGQIMLLHSYRSCSEHRSETSMMEQEDGYAVAKGAFNTSANASSCCCAVLVSMRQDHNLATFRCWPTWFAWIGKEGYGGLGAHQDELFYSLQKIHDIFSQIRNALHYDSARPSLAPHSSTPGLCGSYESPRNRQLCAKRPRKT
jgi:hypothetical protein